MKVLVLMFSLYVISVLCADDKYDSSYDNFDISEILNNRRLLISYSKCLLKKGPCTPEVAEFRDKIPEILETKCAKCTDSQISLAKQLIQELKKKEPAIWDEFLKKYDPQGIHRKDFQNILKVD